MSTLQRPQFYIVMFVNKQLKKKVDEQSLPVSSYHYFRQFEIIRRYLVMIAGIALLSFARYIAVSLFLSLFLSYCALVPASSKIRVKSSIQSSSRSFYLFLRAFKVHKTVCTVHSCRLSVVCLLCPLLLDVSFYSA